MEWIKCSEQMPEYGKIVIFAIDSCMDIAFKLKHLHLRAVVGKWCCHGGLLVQRIEGPNAGSWDSFNLCPVEYWMEFPEMPKVKRYIDDGEKE